MKEKKVIFKCRKGNDVVLHFKNRKFLDEFIKIVSPQKVETITIVEDEKITKIIEL